MAGAQKLEFPNTAYYLPVIYSLTGIKVTDLDSAKQVMDFSRSVIAAPYQERLPVSPISGLYWMQGWERFLLRRLSEAIRYVEDPDFYQPEVEDPDVENGKIWLGAADDAIMRKRGVEFVDGSAPGFAAIVGRGPRFGNGQKDRRGIPVKKHICVHGCKPEWHDICRTAGQGEESRSDGILDWFPLDRIYRPRFLPLVLPIVRECLLVVSRQGDYKKMLAYQKRPDLCVCKCIGRCEC